MSYYHTKCGGEVRLWRRKCKKCGKKWPIITLFTYPPPKDMAFIPPKMPEIKKGKTSYAKWADKFEGSNIIASRLPNWPRWLRILSVMVILATLAGLISWRC